MRELNVVGTKVLRIRNADLPKHRKMQLGRTVARFGMQLTKVFSKVLADGSN